MSNLGFGDSQRKQYNRIIKLTPNQSAPENAKKKNKKKKLNNKKQQRMTVNKPWQNKTAKNGDCCDDSKASHSKQQQIVMEPEY